MSGPKKKSVSASVASQAADSARHAEKVIPLKTVQSASTRLEKGTDPVTGVAFLKAVCPVPEQRAPLTYDLTFLLRFPDLEPAFSAAFILHAVGMKHSSRKQVVQCLSVGFFKFLTEHGSTDLKFDDLTKPIFAAFVMWLNAPRKDGQPWSPATRSLVLSAVRVLFNRMGELREWSTLTAPVRQNIPVNPWPGVARRVVPRVRLDREHLIEIVRAAEKEITEIEERLAEGRRLLAEGLAVSALESRDFSNPAVCLTWLHTEYPGVIPFLKEIRRSDVSLASMIKETCGIEKYDRYLYASSRDMVPFVLLFTVSTAFNADTSLLLEWSGISEVDRLGVPALSVTGPKGRATMDPVILDSSADAEMGLAKLVRLLRELTDRVRGFIDEPAFRDRVFIYVTTQGSVKRVKAFGTPIGEPSNDPSWKHCLADFIDRHSLKPFTLSQIRPTITDESIVVTGDLMAARRIGQHRKGQTLWHHYTSSGTRRRFEERVGEVLMLRERWLATGGMIDPRWRTVAHDKGAATPGFLCFDPFDSPRPNQQRGRLCTAYGECPSCPLAAANVGDPAAVALHLALERAIYAAQGPITPQAWLIRWAPVVADLKGLLSHVPDGVLAEARRYSLSVPLPPVG